MKICSKCLIEKELSEYHKRNNRPCGVRSICKKCYKLYPKNKKNSDNYMRKYDIKKAYGITHEEYEEMLKTQNGVCAICGLVNNHSWKKHLCIDHCHETKQVRGLLCDSCNRGIGLLKDNKDILYKAYEYLSKTRN